MKINFLQKQRTLSLVLISLLMTAGITMANAQAPTGAINGQFTVGENAVVCFSQGNLQYKASTNTWRFAENQWDYVGSDNSNISQTYSGLIDLFGWGTSDYNHGANCYQPWSMSNSDYYTYGNYQYNLFDLTGKADWGYNAISNGGNTENSGLADADMIPSFSYRLSHLLTVCCSISVLSPTFAADSPSAFRNMAKHRILKQCFSPRRYPLSSSNSWASFSSNRTAFLISSKVCTGITRIAA